MKWMAGLILLAGVLLAAGCGELLNPAVNDFGVTVSPGNVTAAAGASGAAFNVTVSPAGRFNGTVTLNVSIQPALPYTFSTPSGFSTQPSATFVYNSPSNDVPVTFPFQVNPNSNQPIPAGSYTITITGTAPSFSATHSATAQLTVPSSNPPTITLLSPSSALAGSGAFTLTVNGTGFTSSSVVNWNGSARTTSFVSATQLTAQITAADVSATGTAAVTVVNPAAQGGTSNSANFSIASSPTITSFSPNSAIAGSGTFTLTVNGSGFVSSSKVDWNGSARATTFVSASQLTAQITAADVSAPGTAAVTVVNPAAQGGTSNSVSFTVNPSITPTITKLAPDDANSGTPGLVLQVFGTNFVQGSTVQWNAANRTTQFVSSTEVDATISAADLANAGGASVTVVNPPAQGGTSNTVQFPINPAPVPGVSELVSIATDNTHSGNGPSDAPAANLDGQWVAFESVATPTNTLTNDTLTNGQSNIFLRNTCLGQDPTCVKSTVLISRADPSFSAAPNNNSVTPVVSASGRFVAFQSDATNLVPGGVANNGFPKIFRAEPGNGTVLISQASNGALPNNDSHEPAISASGRFVAFRSPASNLIPNPTGADQIYVRDTCFEAPAGCTTSTILASADNSGNAGFGFNDAPSISADGRFVAFESLSGNLVQGVGDGTNREIFLRDTCAGASACTPSIIHVSTGFTDGAPAHFSTTASVSGDGRYVAFEAVASPQGLSFHEVYLRDTCIGAAGCTPSTTLVSVQLNSAASDGDSESPSISVDGRYVAYVSNATRQVANDTNGFLDHFVRDTCIGAPAGCTPKTVRISTKTDGTQANRGDPIGILVAIARNGQAAAFASSASNLVMNDNNNAIDVFLALTGFSSPVAAPVIQSLAPSSATHGGGDFVLTVTGGSGAGIQFAPGAQVQWNGSPRDTIFVNSSTLKVFIPAADIASAGTAEIVIVNPDPGGQSAAFAFIIN